MLFTHGHRMPQGWKGGGRAVTMPQQSGEDTRAGSSSAHGLSLPTAASLHFYKSDNWMIADIADQHWIMVVG